ncbi:MAG: HNH endonuclease [Duncaniella sp.]|nr:HNH endonuclease [Duncaniella sp.]
MDATNQNMMSFFNYQSDFYHFLISDGKLAKKTASDYISRLKFLARYYELNENFSQEKLDRILTLEDSKRTERDIYSSRKSISDFSAGLKKFLEFTQSDFNEKRHLSELNEVHKIENSTDFSPTERAQLVKSRIGQGDFRANLIKYWGGCAVTGCEMTELLVASHIKPWSVSTNFERLDLHNGLLLLPNLDKLFDLGYISFRDDGRIIISRLLHSDDYEAIGISNRLILRQSLTAEHQAYLSYHRDACFIN